MADSKITALTAISTVDPAADPLVIVDVSDTSMAASGTTKKGTINQLLGAGGTATLASATITGALTVDTTTLVVNPAGYADRVGIGTATPAHTLQVQAAGGHIVSFTDGTTPGSLYSSGGYAGFTIPAGTNGFFINPSGNFATIATNGIENVRVESAGNLKVNYGNLILGTSGKGIDFSATASGSGTMTSELLSDYEEGTFTPAITFGGANVGMTGTFAGRYTKVGRAVTINGIIALTAKGSSTGLARITGLPFVSANAAAEYTAISIRLDRVSFSDAPCGYIGSNASVVELENTTNAGTVTNLTEANFINTSVVIINSTYTV